MKKRIVIKLSGQVFSMDQTKMLKDYATFFVKKSKTYQPIIIAGGYDLMDIVALKVIERSKIKTKIIKADIKTIEKAMKGQPVGTQIVP